MNNTEAPMGMKNLEYAAWLVETARMELEAKGKDPARVDAALAEIVEVAKGATSPLSEDIRDQAIAEYVAFQLRDVEGRL